MRVYNKCHPKSFCVPHIFSLRAYVLRRRVPVFKHFNTFGIRGTFPCECEEHFYSGVKKRLEDHQSEMLYISEWSEMVGLGTLGGDANATATAML
jgi:hypothetical protein